MDINKTRSLQYVRRFNFEYCNKYQSVAEHSFYVALLAHEMAKIVGYASPEFCMKMALLHDITESVTGDIPFLTKRALGRLAIVGLENRAEKELGISLSAQIEVIKIVDYCDALELALYLKEERKSGNTTLIDIEHETWKRLVVLVDGQPSVEFKWAASLIGTSTEIMSNQQKDLPNDIKH